MTKQVVNIEVKTEDIKDALLTKMDRGDPNIILIVNTIVDNLVVTPRGISQLLMAFNGIRSLTNLKADDEVLIKFSEIITWNRDKQKMIDEGLVFQDHIKGKIVSINLQKLLPISVSYEGYNISGIKTDFEEDFKEDQITKGEKGLLE